MGPLWTHMTGAALRRAALFALIMGSILTLANQYDAVFGTQPLRFLPLAFVYLAPFVVVSISQLLGARQAAAETGRAGQRRSAVESFVTTMLSHGIPTRAVILGILTGSVNAAIVATTAVLEHEILTALPMVPIVQAFSLPIVFGALSQAIAYRRAALA